MGGERGSRFSQSRLYSSRGRVRAAEHAPRDPLSVLARHHGLAEIVECGAAVLEERRRVDQTRSTGLTAEVAETAPRCAIELDTGGPCGVNTPRYRVLQ